MAKEEAIVTSQRRVVSGVFLLLVVGGLAIATSIAAGQSAPEAGFIRTQTRITGDGPWTSWLGGAAQRTVIVTIENTSDHTLREPVVDLWLERGGDRTPVSSRTLDDLAPGETTTLDVDVTLPRFSFGTHAVEGTVGGAAEPVPLRAETSHVPWLLLLLPSIGLAQVALVALRDRVRRHLHVHPTSRAVVVVTPGDEIEATTESQTTTQPASASGRAAEPGVAAFIDATLDDAFAGLDRWPSNDDRFLAAVHQRARATTAFVADRFAIPYAERPALAAQITRALLDRTASPRALRG